MGRHGAMDARVLCALWLVICHVVPRATASHSNVTASNGHSDAVWHSQGGLIEFYARENKAKKVQFQIISVSEQDTAGQTVQWTSILSTLLFGWTKVETSQSSAGAANIARVDSAMTLPIVGFSGYRGMLALNLSTMLTTGSALVSIGNGQQFQLSNNSLELLFSLDQWPFLSPSNRLTILGHLKVPGQQDKWNVSKTQGGRAKRLQWDEAILDTATEALLDGVAGTANCSATASGSNVLVSWTFPSYSQTLRYDPALYVGVKDHHVVAGDDAKDRKEVNIGVIVGATVGSLAFLGCALGAGLGFKWWAREKQRKSPVRLRFYSEMDDAELEGSKTDNNAASTPQQDTVV